MTRLIERSYALIACLVAVSSLAGCGTAPQRKSDGPPSEYVNVATVPDAVPRVEPRSRYGNPNSYVVFGKRYYVMNSSEGFIERGIASWYGKKFHGRRTSSGETYNMYAMTAAHKSLPLPTYAEVTNLENGRRVIVKVNDRGPFHENRIIDLSYAAATKLGITGRGTGLVEVRAINPRSYNRDTRPARYQVRTNEPINEFYIQIGAFSELMNAEGLRRRVSLDNDNLVNISQAVIDGQMLYRVRIGPIDDVILSDSIVDQLLNMGISDHRIVVD